MLRHRLTVARTTAAALALASLASGAACGNGSEADPFVAPVVTALERAAEGVPAADAAACATEQQVVERAVEAFTLLEGRPPGDVDELVPDWLRSPSTLFVVVDGRVLAAPGSPCSLPD